MIGCHADDASDEIEILEMVLVDQARVWIYLQRIVVTIIIIRWIFIFILFYLRKINKTKEKSFMTYIAEYSNRP